MSSLDQAPVKPESDYRSAFVGLIGRPNVGKSTLLNRLVGRPVAITSRKPQTTRTRILGVLHGEGYQIVFVDTPGVHISKAQWNRHMVARAYRVMRETDLNLVLVEPHRGIGPEQLLVFQRALNAKAPCWLILNKIDSLDEAEQLSVLQSYHQELQSPGESSAAAQNGFAEIFPISARTGRGIKNLLRAIEAMLPHGVPYFPPQEYTDQSEAQQISEWIRQEIFRRTVEEVPYGVAVRIEGIEPRAHILVVHARILVERASQQGILIGAQGRMLKAIGQSARLHLEAMLKRRLHLALRVDVKPNWTRHPHTWTELGYGAS